MITLHAFSRNVVYLKISLPCIIERTVSQVNVPILDIMVGLKVIFFLLSKTIFGALIKANISGLHGQNKVYISNIFQENHPSTMSV